MELPKEMPYQEEEINVEDVKKELKDQLPPGIEYAIKQHNDIIKSINAYEENIAELTPYQLARLEHYYNKAEREAWKIAGYYKSQYQYYNGRALTERGSYYIRERANGQMKTVDINDSNYKSRIKEGENLEIAGIYEGYYVTWKGIANSYEGAVNVLKDMIKAINHEGG